MKGRPYGFNGYKIYPRHGGVLCQDPWEVFQFLMQNACLCVSFQEGSSWDELDCPLGEKHIKREDRRHWKAKYPHAAKSQGAIAGVVLPDKMTKWNQKLEGRKAQQEQDFRAAKEAKQGETTQWLLLRAPQRQHVSKRNTCGCFCHLTWW